MPTLERRRLSDEAMRSSAEPRVVAHDRSHFLTHPVFNTHHTETEMLRYIRRLEAKDLSLTTLDDPARLLHDEAERDERDAAGHVAGVRQAASLLPAGAGRGLPQLFAQLESWLAEITGFAAVSLEPNAGSQGEYAGLLVIRKYHESRGEGHRDICLIPTSAHGTNPASAVMAGMKVVR